MVEHFPQKSLTALHDAINKRGVISAYVEQDQNLDKVLNIFIRVNSAGTVLSYSDLLLSIATAQWKSLDAREEIYNFVGELNNIGRGFSFTKDFVLKSSLMLAGLDTRWTVSNFTSDNMERIEGLWRDITGAIRITVRLLDTYGFSGDSLPSVNAVIPIAYYIYKRENPPSFADARSYSDERTTIKRWLNIALLKRTFTGQPDSILRVCRDTIDSSELPDFPDEQIVSAMRQTPQSMRFDEEELDALLDNEYGKTYTFVVLSVLYPWIDFRNKLHQDHIHPRSSFSIPGLRKAGISDPRAVSILQDSRDKMPNLQLLQGLPNTEKSDIPFAKWMHDQYPDEDARRHYMKQHFIPADADFSMMGFPSFCRQRRALMLEALKERVGWRAAHDRPETPDTRDADDISTLRLD